MKHIFLMSNCEEELYKVYIFMIILWVSIGTLPLEIPTYLTVS